MSFKFVRHRTDSTQDEIVEALEKAGYIVDRDSRVDLQFRHPTWMPNVFVKIECKTENRKAGFVPDKRQREQTDYCHAHGVPYIFSAEQALTYAHMRGLKLLEW